MATRFPQVTSAEQVEAFVEEIGFLPFVPGGIEGFSLKDITPQDRWFKEGVEGPWEWREIIADRGKVAYAKIFAHKAGFVSRALYPDFVNWRRAGLPFEERYARGEIGRMEKQVFDIIAKCGPTLTRTLRGELGEKGLDRAVSMLQMRTDLVIQRMEYRRDAFGRAYGMGVSRLAPGEVVFGEDLMLSAMEKLPEVSRQRIYDHAAALFPEASEKNIHRLLRW